MTDPLHRCQEWNGPLHNLTYDGTSILAAVEEPKTRSFQVDRSHSPVFCHIVHQPRQRLSSCHDDLFSAILIASKAASGVAQPSKSIACRSTAMVNAKALIGTLNRFATQGLVCQVPRTCPVCSVRVVARLGAESKHHVIRIVNNKIRRLLHRGYQQNGCIKQVVSQ